MLYTHLPSRDFFFLGLKITDERSSGAMTFPKSVALQPFKTFQPSRGVIVKAQ